MVYEPQSAPAHSPSQQTACEQQVIPFGVDMRLLSNQTHHTAVATQRPSPCAALQAERSERDALGSERAAAFFAGWLPLLLHPALRLPALELVNPRWGSLALCGSASTLRLPKWSYGC
jgi:hypothetical protein